jgi:hypothetical protein
MIDYVETHGIRIFRIAVKRRPQFCAPTPFLIAPNESWRPHEPLSGAREAASAVLKLEPQVELNVPRIAGSGVVAKRGTRK